MTHPRTTPLAFMPTIRMRVPVRRPSLDEVVERACSRIAPTWPLDRFIAVNPFWPLIDRPLPVVSAELGALSGTRLLMPRAWYREEWRQGRLRVEDLREAIVESGSSTTEAGLRSLLESDEPPTFRRLRVMDVVDQQRDLLHEPSWRDFVAHGVSQLCAWYFDEGRAPLSPTREEGLYTAWRRQALHDESPALLMGLDQYGALAQALPETAAEMTKVAVAHLDVPAPQLELYLAGLLLDLNGWASWCAYRRWTARLAGADDHQIRELLAIRLAWEWLLLRAGGGELWPRWRMAIAAWPKLDVLARDAQAEDWLLQRALEIAWQRQLCRRLPVGLGAEAPVEPAVQAVFCIDVRSEVFRRALETADPRVQTLGFAGFFGMPIEYQPLGGSTARPQLPGLLAPRLRVTDVGTPAGLAERRRERLAVGSAWDGFKASAASGFSFVEAMGPLFAGKLFGDAFGRGRRAPEGAGLRPAEDAARKPRLTALAGGGTLELEARCELAASMLRAMGLTRGFARLVLLVGHGSQTRNNPHAAGLDCGACCGQTGEVNARAAAALLDEPEVRAGLAARGIVIPASTRFVAGLHDTTTDEVTLFDLDELPASHAHELAELRVGLAAASARARRERAARLGLDTKTYAPLLAKVKARARDWGEVRPEWGLANNAALIVAPREHSRHLDLEGRAFLHDYRWQDDEGFATLELVMTAPMVVAHWINLQYYASTVDNARYGSGNKLLHDVVGGHLGVFEGNGGDLRIGLPLQSLHDGQRWVHAPLRLSVFIEAPRAEIDAVLRKHAQVRQLVENEWLYLFQLDAPQRAVYARRRASWQRVTERDAPDHRGAPETTR